MPGCEGIGDVGISTVQVQRTHITTEAPMKEITSVLSEDRRF